jgi:hypothetical protein
MKRSLIALIGALLAIGLTVAPATAREKTKDKVVSGTYSGAQFDTTYWTSCDPGGFPQGGRRQFDGTLTSSYLGSGTLSFDVSIGFQGDSTRSWSFTLPDGSTLSGWGRIEVASDSPFLTRVHLEVLSGTGRFTKVTSGDLSTTPEALPVGLECNTPLLTQPYFNTVSGTLTLG